jgi:DNA-binding MarR family transcriptional regulator
MDANMTQHGQRDLPLASVEEADAAYEAAVDDLLRFASLSPAAGRLLKEIIRRGRRETGCLVMPCTSQRNGARAVGLALSSFSRSLDRLQKSRLVIRADGALRLVLPHLVEVAEEARARAAPNYGRFDAADSLRLLGGARSTVSHDVPRCSKSARSVPKKENTPVPSLNPELRVNEETDTEGRAPAEHAGQRGTRRDGAARPGALRHDPAWECLQTRHFRPRLDLAALRSAFWAAVDAGFLGDDYHFKLRFLATAWDLACDVPRPGHEGIRSPAVVLRSRIERQTCYRQSDAALAWAKQTLRPPDLRRDEEAAATEVQAR